MVSRTTVMTLPLAAALALVGCSGTEGEQADSTPQTEQSASSTAAPEESATASSSAKATGQDPDTSNDVDDLPDYVKPYPDSTVLSASIVKAHNDKDTKKPEQVSLVVQTKAEAKDIFEFYDKELGKADFEPLGAEVKTKSARVMNFRHKDNDSVLVVTIADDGSDKDQSIVTIGGNIAP